MPRRKYSVCYILASIVDMVCSSPTVPENSRYFSPRNSRRRSYTGDIDALRMLELPPRGTSDRCLAQDGIYFINTQPAVECEA
jgi:hypothetical protein